MDGGLVLQRSYQTRVETVEDFLPAETEVKGTTYRCNRLPTQEELEDLLFGWRVEAGVTSNSVLFVKDRTTVGIGTGEQDRVGVAQIAARKAEERTGEGALEGAVMISDGFFPFRDGVDVGLKRGVTAVAQPGGSVRDREIIEACNEYSAAMVFTGERSFRH
jgi:phosphoribosylaminoimidazolecarboxamide formyltransferase/IMP cyclohydrolase